MNSFCFRNGKDSVMGAFSDKNRARQGRGVSSE